MTYLGEVKNGIVEFKEGAALPEGTMVRIEPVETLDRPPRAGSPEAIASCDARWVGPPEELDRLLGEVQQSREADLKHYDQVRHV
jgi:hypothetical protein